MILARVVGNVIATQKNQHLAGRKLLILQPVNAKGEPAGAEVLAVDGIGAGEGDLVIAIAEGGSARQVARAENLAPIDIVVAGIVDVMESEQGTIKL